MTYLPRLRRTPSGPVFRASTACALSLLVLAGCSSDNGSGPATDASTPLGDGASADGSGSFDAGAPDSRGSDGAPFGDAAPEASTSDATTGDASGTDGAVGDAARTDATTGDAGTGTLASRLVRAFVGTYVLSCGDGSSAPAQHTVVIAADGSATLDGAVVVDGTHLGSVSLYGTELVIEQQGGDELTIDFAVDTTGALADGTGINNASGPLQCQAVSGKANPSLLTPASIAGALATTVSVECMGEGAPSGKVQYTLDGTGTAKVGTVTVSGTDAETSFSFTDARTFGSASDARSVDLSSGATEITSIFDDGGLNEVDVQVNDTSYRCAP